MNPEEIKVGETYNVRMRVTLIETNRYRFVCRPLKQDGTPSVFSPNYFNFAEAEAFYPAENGIKNTESAPKYDPCREFKNGDIVRYVKRDGRSYVAAPPVGATCRVIVGEDSVEMVMVEFKFSENEESAVYDVPFYHLELVTPVEELEPYSVETCQYGYTVNKGEDILATYNDEKHPNAKAAAEAECARLNAKWRKEHENGRNYTD